MTLGWGGYGAKSPAKLSRFITSSSFREALLTLRHGSTHSYLNENKLAEVCASRTHRRHQGCRPPVLKTGRITGPHALPIRDKLPGCDERFAGLLRLSHYPQVWFQRSPSAREFLLCLLLRDSRWNDDVVSGFPIYRSRHVVFGRELYRIEHP